MASSGTYTEELKGEWVWRSDRKAHLIESVISDELVTNCGRRLDAEFWLMTDPPYVDPDDAPPDMYCRMCS